jgi:hypothetical protein
MNKTEFKVLELKQNNPEETIHFFLLGVLKRFEENQDDMFMVVESNNRRHEFKDRLSYKKIESMLKDFIPLADLLSRTSYLKININDEYLLEIKFKDEL